MKNLDTKLVLNKQTLSSLSNNEMSHVKGGFTYSISVGHECKYSKSLGATTKVACDVLSVQIQVIASQDDD